VAGAWSESDQRSGHEQARPVDDHGHNRDVIRISDALIVVQERTIEDLRHCLDQAGTDRRQPLDSLAEAKAGVTTLQTHKQPIPANPL
jgi:hypothetical protein